MVSLTFAIPDEIKSEIKKLSWVNWSELSKEELLKEIKREEMLERFKEIISKSKFTEKNVELLSKKVKDSMYKRLKAEGLI
ncbi:MAG: hypothetical protein AABW56_02560 [Nanoarchaeota archaeon]